MPTLELAPTVIEPRFRGFPGLAHGGHLAGMLAAALGAEAAEVRLRRPVPTGLALTLDHTPDGTVELHDGTMLLAVARPSALALDVPAPVSLAEAEAAARRFPGHRGHLFGGCFGCGPDRERGDGLRLEPGPVPGRRLVATPWVPDGDGPVPLERVWAAFDCPQLWALIAHAPAGTPDMVVTASLAARVERPVVAGRPHVLVAWPMGRDGRAWVAGAALFGPDGERCAVSRQVAALADWGLPLDRRCWQAD